MPILTCPITSCDYATEDLEIVGAAALMNIHAITHQQPTVQQQPAASRRAPKLERPKLKANATNDVL